MKYRHRAALLLLLFGALAWTACDTVDDPPVEEEEEETLRSLARKRGIEIGAAVGTGLPFSDPKYAQVLAAEFGMLTPENAMKFGSLHPTRTTYNFADADALVDFAEAREMKVRGHTLVWHTQLPSWVSLGTFTRDELIEVLRDHITTVVTRYKGRLVAWDVVNEAIADNGTLRRTIWHDVIGPEYIAMAFEWAHAADPTARLFYNDYSAEGRGTKSDAVYALVRQLKEQGVPIHGVGLQMHFSTGFAPPAADIASNIARLGELGLEVHVTEMDVRMPVPATEANLARQAATYHSMLNVCLDAWNCTTFVLWGFTDRYSWVPSAFQGQGAALIFDEEYEPKVAYRMMRQALEQ